jgi:hypothetical protein
MVIRRIAAAGGVALALLAGVPGVAMASTAGSSPPVSSPAGPGPKPGQILCAKQAVVKRGGGPVAPVTAVGCCARLVKRGYLVKRGHLVRPGGQPVLRKVSSRPFPIAALGCCPALPIIHPGFPVKRGVGHVSTRTLKVIAVAACGTGQSMTFDLPAYSSTATEVSGPRLTAHELVIYMRQLFMIRSVNGDSFTVARLFPRQRPARLIRIGTLPAFTNGATAITDGHAIVFPGPVAIAIRAK